MTDCLRGLQGALIAHLRGESTLTALLGDPVRVYDELPRSVVAPYVSFGRLRARDIGGVEGAVDEQVLSLLCVSRFGGTEEVRAIVSAVREAVQDAGLTLEGGVLVSLSVLFVDVFRAADLRSVYGVVRVRAVIEAAE